MIQAACCLVLASASPRRRDLIGLLGVPARVAPQSVDESVHLLVDPVLAALSVALAKARAGASELGAEEVVLGADTVVVAQGAILGKPASADEARRILRTLRGAPHEVATGIALRTPDGREWGGVVTTRVHMRAYAEREIEAYIARGEPFDKAGGYAVQDAQFRPVERLEGCYLNVVGLPLCAVARGLETLGLPPAVSTSAPLVPPCTFCRAGEPLVAIG